MTINSRLDFGNKGDGSLGESEVHFLAIRAFSKVAFYTDPLQERMQMRARRRDCHRDENPASGILADPYTY
jgi:hypothetical protein